MSKKGVRRRRHTPMKRPMWSETIAWRLHICSFASIHTSLCQEAFMFPSCVPAIGFGPGVQHMLAGTCIMSQHCAWRARTSPRPLSQQWPMRSNVLRSLDLCTLGQSESRDSLLVLVLHQSLHGTVGIITDLCKAQRKVITMPLLNQGAIGARCAAMWISGHTWPWQSVLLNSTQSFWLVLIKR